MKNFLLSLTLLSILLAPACTAVPINTRNNDKVVYAHSDMVRDLEPAIYPQRLNALVNGNNAFAFNFYNEINTAEGNIIFSPLSLSLALSMTLAGAEDSTKAEMLNALALQELGDDLHPAINALLLAIDTSQVKLREESEGDQFQLNIANSIWGQSGFDFEKTFLDTIALNYGAGIYKVDYVQDPEAAREAINDWVADETQDKILDLIPQGAIDALTRLVLANAIYFNGSWLYPFEKDSTRDAPFTLLDGAQVPVAMMHLPGERLVYLQEENFQLVELPYLSRDFSMVLLVPDAGEFEAVESALSADNIAESLNKTVFVPVDLKMPKFDFETSVAAPEPLMKLGMLKAFQPGEANFSGISRSEALFISDVLHKATITVDEEGTEAAAATAVIMSLTSAPDVVEPISLVIDRPFIFFIQHQPTGTILFMGCVMEP